MENSKTTRRQLFRKLITRFTNNAQDKDPLFEKYSRKIYNGRRYAPNSYANKMNAKNTQVARVKPITSGLAQYAGTWSSREATYLLQRTGFGYKKLHVDTLVALSFDQAIDQVLTINPAAAPPINNYQPDTPDENNVPYGGDWTNGFFTDIYGDGYKSNYQRTQSLRAWCIDLTLNHDISIREKMTLFWYHFIPIDFETVLVAPHDFTANNSSRICYQYMKNLRDNAVGNYKDLIRSIATQPAMMYQLNNQANQKGSPDENFAREIMELFTIGKDVPNTYTQADVVQAAKVLTGWRVEGMDTANVKTNFNANKHDASDKKFSAFFNSTVIKNQGDKEIDTFIDMLFTKSEIISQYICRRLYRFFVYYDIDDNIETNVIKPLAQLFVDKKWDILPVLKKLFKSEHFFDTANREVYIKSPLDFFVGTMRTFNATYNIADSGNHDLQYRVWYDFRSFSQQLLQSIGTIPNISGWQAFYQKPSYHEYWINSNTIQKRQSLMEQLFNGFYVYKGAANAKIEINFIVFVQQFSPTICENPNLLVDECVKYLLALDLSPELKKSIKTKTLLSNQASDSNYYWTDSWNDYLANPNDTIKADEVKKRIKEMLLTIVELAEYQLM
jgi:uncharacterized protein (DUF1800 family)